MADGKREPTQQSQPKGKDGEGGPAKPMDMLAPKRREFLRLLSKVEKRQRRPA